MGYRLFFFFQQETAYEVPERCRGSDVVSSDPSYMVSYAMQKRGYRIIPVNPAAAGQTILGETCYASLEEVPEPVELVNVFRRSEYCAEVAREAAAIGAKVLWLQQGIISQEAADIAQEHGMTVIMDRCIKVEDSITQAVRKG
ncbi:CoA-binding protein [Paenibacillus sp. 28ISP30-2]|nr:CoA-binding protein [Paenibacillus sp. 28ISP30-2]